MERQPIPTDHLIPPTEGRVGFRGFTQYHPPFIWEQDHQLAEAGGYARMGRRYQMIAELGQVIRLPCAPVVVLYHPMLSRVRAAGAWMMGWCVDA